MHIHHTTDQFSYTTDLLKQTKLKWINNVLNNFPPASNICYMPKSL